MSTTNSWWRTDATQWRAHGWAIEVRGDELAEISHDGRTLVRGIRAAVRDHGWLTVPVAVLSMETEDAGLALELRHDGLGAVVRSRLSIQATPVTLTVSWDAVNGPAFDTCRTGLVVLHPASDAGRPVRVTHADGGIEHTRFPEVISPHQPVRDIRALQISDEYEIVFAGDVFEMEDQRNWSDASFKTYSRPLDLPYPYRMDAGERVQQSITVRVTGASAVSSPGDPDRITLSPGGAFPAIGVEASTAPDPVPASAVGAFRVVELNLTTPTWRAALDRAASDGLPLDVRLVTDNGALLDEAVATVRAVSAAPGVVAVTAFDAAEHVTDQSTADALRVAMTTAGLDAPVLAGARSHFTELNREQSRIARDVDGMVVNTTPLFHTLDTEQLVESLAMQHLIARQSVVIAGGLPVHIGPVALRPRFNNVATAPEDAPTRSDLSEGYGAQFTGGVDERQSAPELGAWLVASAAALAVDGVASLSWFETWGPRGLESSDWCAPAADAVDALIGLHGATALTGESPDGLVWAIGSRSAPGDQVLVANLDRVARDIDVTPIGRISLSAGTWGRLEG